MNPLSKFSNRRFVIIVLSIIFVPSILVGLIKGIEEASVIEGLKNFFLCSLYVIVMLALIKGIPFLFGDFRKWLKVRNTPEYLYEEVMQKRNGKSLQKLEELAKNDDLKAIYFYALVHYMGNDIIPSNADKAFYWASKGAQKGYGLAQNLLGGLYLNGIGTVIDYQKSVYWFEESIKNNVHESEIGLYQCYEQGGYGIEQDLYKAFLHLRNYAKRTDDIVSKFTVATWLFEGYGVEENKDEAFKWFREIANTENTGTYYDEEFDDAVTWSSTRPEEAVVNSYYNLAICYQNGYGTPVNEETAKYWMNKYDAAVSDNKG